MPETKPERFMNSMQHYAVAIGLGSALAGAAVHYFTGLDSAPINLVLPESILQTYRHLAATNSTGLNEASAFVGFMGYGILSSPLWISMGIRGYKKNKLFSP